MADELLGVEEIAKNLRSIERKVERKILTKANRAGATVLRREIRKALPKTGVLKMRRWKSDVEGKKGQSEDVHLRDRIGIRKKKGRSGHIEHVVGYVGLARAYGHVVEFGSRYMTGNRVWTRTMRRVIPLILRRHQEVISREINKL